MKDEQVRIQNAKEWLSYTVYALMISSPLTVSQTKAIQKHRKVKLQKAGSKSHGTSHDSLRPTYLFPLSSNLKHPC
jgi:hypothetical protein